MMLFAVLTNDLQHAAAFKHEERKRAVKEFLPHQVRFLHSARQLGVPVVHLQLVVGADDPRSEGLPDELRYTEGSVGATILPEVVEKGDHIVKKRKDSGFFETELHALLTRLGVGTVVITGMQTQICVQLTAADAHFRGYFVIIPSDCVVSTRPEDTASALDWLAKYCARVMKSDEILELMSKC